MRLLSSGRRTLLLVICKRSRWHQRSTRKIVFPRIPIWLMQCVRQLCASKKPFRIVLHEFRIFPLIYVNISLHLMSNRCSFPIHLNGFDVPIYSISLSAIRRRRSRTVHKFSRGKIKAAALNTLYFNLVLFSYSWRKNKYISNLVGKLLSIKTEINVNVIRSRIDR